ncbi:hypothetical protein MHBO_002710, partial [Bonamia ostreae]
MLRETKRFYPSNDFSEPKSIPKMLYNGDCLLRSILRIDFDKNSSDFAKSAPGISEAFESPENDDLGNLRICLEPSSSKKAAGKNILHYLHLGITENIKTLFGLCVYVFGVYYEGNLDRRRYLTQIVPITKELLNNASFGISAVDDYIIPLVFLLVSEETEELRSFGCGLIGAVSQCLFEYSKTHKNQKAVDSVKDFLAPILITSINDESQQVFKSCMNSLELMSFYFSPSEINMLVLPLVAANCANGRNVKAIKILERIAFKVDPENEILSLATACETLSFKGNAVKKVLAKNFFCFYRCVKNGVPPNDFNADKMLEIFKKFVSDKNWKIRIASLQSFTEIAAVAKAEHKIELLKMYQVLLIDDYCYVKEDAATIFGRFVCLYDSENIDGTLIEIYVGFLSSENRELVRICTLDFYIVVATL